MMLKIFLVSALITITSGCASNSVPKSHTLDFKTRIIDQKLKQFKIQMQPKFIPTGLNTDKALKARRQNYATLKSQARSIDRKKQNILINQLNQKIEETQYCTQGYWIIDTNIHTNAPFLFGECNDVATNKDIKRFRNTISKW